MEKMTNKNNIQPGIEQLLVKIVVEKKTSALGMVLPDNDNTQTMSGEVILAGLATPSGGAELQEARQIYFDNLIGLSVIFHKNFHVVTLIENDDTYAFVEFKDVLGLTNVK